MNLAAYLFCLFNFRLGFSFNKFVSFFMSKPGPKKVVENTEVELKEEQAKCIE
jgi:hypothetical protein